MISYQPTTPRAYGTPPPPVVVQQKLDLSRWELVQMGFWLGLGIIGASIVVGIIVGVVLAVIANSYDPYYYY